MTFLHLLWDTGLRWRCPVCEQGQLFKDYFTMNSVCSHCSVRFERYEGAVVGGMSISIVMTALIFLVGYTAAEVFTDWSVWIHLAMWMPFALFFPVLFYPYSRAIWVVFLHLFGDVHWDYETYQEPEVSIADAFLNRTPDDEPDELDFTSYYKDDLI